MPSERDQALSIPAPSPLEPATPVAPVPAAVPRTRSYTLKATGPAKGLVDYDSGLNDEQRAVALCQEGPTLVIAGAGSGKTRALTYRV
ncbi:MAG: ATP-dependent helicase, partial [Deltaproteobacteria bacterium]|nr:ATP-dependent helicase [Deltaproteobacteria bacterium]